MSTLKAMLACPPMPVERGITVQEERTMNTQEESMMKGARYRSTIFLSGAGGENTLDDALMLLTEAMPGANSKKRIKHFAPHLADVPPFEVTYASKRRNRLFTYGCEDFKEVTRFKVREEEDRWVIELRLKTLGGFPLRWCKALSTSLPDWHLLVAYQSRDDHVSGLLSLDAGISDIKKENRTFQMTDDVLLPHPTGQAGKLPGS
jgi:hypothetical protein